MAEFKNPNQAGGGGAQDNRSLLVMLVVMSGLFFGVRWYQAKHNPQTASPSAPVAQQAAPVAATGLGGVPASPTAPIAVAATHKPGAPATTAQTVQATAESTTVVENELYRITFSNRGGQATSWILKKYRDNQGQPLDLVHDGAARLFGYPLSLYTYDPALTQGLAQALYVPSSTGTLQAPGSLSFDFSSGNIAVHKTFTFDSTYTIHADTVVLRDGVPVRALLAWPSGLGDAENLQAYAGALIDASQNGKDTHESFKKVSNGNTLNGPFDWVGVSDQYFAAIFLPDAPQAVTVATLHNQIDVNKAQRTNGVGPGVPAKDTKPVLVPVLGAALGDVSGHTQTRVFVGPKALNVLGAIRSTTGDTLKPLVDFGFFGVIGKPLFLVLRWIHDAIAPAAAMALSVRDRSWGWAIILLTVLINVVLLPLRFQSMRSALKMQRIQPGVEAIKAKYGKPKATDPKSAEMNAEVMAYQKSQGVSMFGGCIPSLVQLPLLYAFFTMLTRVVELRQAHFFWLPDLSAADPYYILPIVMVVSSFLVQYYTPSPGVDPQQQKMMAYMMPLFSGWICLKYASGLALYWVVGNFIMIAQQAVMNRTALGREMREIALKRAKLKAASKAGAPKTIQARR
ncbi:MAG: membrane protein insertase YidC [Acidobacteriota bacterium]|nr:membrane protein insertase YidC [Acidobacteriota bacterium]